MPNGNLSGLYTFEEVSLIYKMDASTIRKQIKNGRFIIDKEIKKFGKTWIITEKAMTEHYGEAPLRIYNQEKILNDLKNKRDEKVIKAAATIKTTKQKIKKSSPGMNDLSSIDEDDDTNAGWNETISGDVLNSFNF